MNLTNIRWAYRSLVRSKGFFATAAITLGLALGLCTTTFGILDSVEHPYTPVYQPDRVLRIRLNGIAQDARASTFQRFLMIRGQTQFASDVAWISFRAAAVGIGEREYSITAVTVTPNYLGLLGVKPLLGRWFDSSAGPTGTVVLGEGAWQRWFPGRKTLDGATVRVNDQTLAVIGVVPNAVGGVLQATPIQGAGDSTRMRGEVYARLRAGVTRDEAHRALATLARQLNEQYDPARRTFSFMLSDMTPHAIGGRGFDVLFAAVGFLVLAIACVNLGGMMLARGIARRRDIALRLALGATRAAIVQQLLAESLVIAGAGCLLGMPIAVWGLFVVQHEVPRQLWFVGQIEARLSWRVFAFAVVAAALVAVVIGVFPGLRASQVSLDEPLKESSSGLTGRRRQRYSVLAMTQLAMAMALLMGTGLLIRSARLIAGYDFGFDTDHLVYAQYWMFNAGPGTAMPSLPHLLDLARSVPGVKAAAVLSGGAGNVPQQVFPDKPLPDGRIVGAVVGRATAGFTEVLGLPLLEGRGFEDGDVGTAVAIVDHSAALKLFLGEDPLGHLIKLGSIRSKDVWVRIVGVVQDAELGFQNDPEYPHTPVIYLPPNDAAQFSARLLARVSGNDEVVASALARELRTSLALRLPPIAGPFVATTGLDAYSAEFDFVAVLFSVFGGVALGLAAVGLYAVVAYAATQRRREFAIRSALGASARELLKEAAHDGTVMTLAGIGVGAFIAMSAAMLLKRFLYGLYPVDAISLVGAEVALLSAAFLACLGPARRAMKADPAEILRAV